MTRKSHENDYNRDIKNEMKQSKKKKIFEENLNVDELD
jgi:hypothetical protein